MKKEHVKVAFTTNDLERVDAKFEKARYFAFYEVSYDGAKFLNSVEFDDNLDEEEQLAARCRALKGCAVLFLHGAPLGTVAAFHMVTSKIFATRITTVQSIAELVASMQRMIENSPPLWLKKAMQAAGGEAVDAEAAA